MRLLLILVALANLAAALAPARCLPRTRYLRCCVEAEASSLEEAGQADASSGSAAALECPIAVRAVRGKGLGAFAVAAVPAGARVCSYHGEALTQRRVAERYGAGAAAQADYLFELRAPSAEAEGLYVDAARSQHPSRFINHAEDGNLVPRPVGRRAHGLPPAHTAGRSLLTARSLPPTDLAPDAHATRSATATRTQWLRSARARRWRARYRAARSAGPAPESGYAMGGDSTSTPLAGSARCWSECYGACRCRNCCSENSWRSPLPRRLNCGRNRSSCGVRVLVAYEAAAQCCDG